MFEDFISRENRIFEILQRFLDEKLDFVVVGGYAVSAYKHRFSMDADIVVSSEDITGFDRILKENDFKKTISKKLKDTRLKHTRFLFVRYEKSKGPAVKVDLLVGGVMVRQTSASFSFELLMENSSYRKIMGTEKEVTARVPGKELLIAMKIHSGRLTDFRDVAALARDTDPLLVGKFISAGDKNKVREHLNKLGEIIDTRDFIHSFQGVFAEKKFDVDVKAVKEICGLTLN